ncbi:UDP-glucuronate 4-epimerase [Pseudomonas sp. WPR_5_2]|uniref:NAD-dependent epimerase n=1 Tax=Pseudomonas sp. WPR_5_2 TaxID=1907371 RepID=UPI000EB30B73|nr:NAD-dependent epimerase [Pseudomonas sp. WPR_5_2]RKS28659.1 UDP-glucuronate 4-epimerase [Pseudomonas sp. WPR_5_2]
MKYLVTGAAGFIGSSVAHKLCEAGHEVVGIDNINSYYDPGLKLARLELLSPLGGFKFIKVDLSEKEAIARIFSEHKFERVIHLGAQAGVRYSIDNPHAYIDSNINGHLNILEGCRNNGIEHLVYASSSSVYGTSNSTPYKTSSAVDHPISLYAATKRSNELMAHTYSHLFDIPVTGLRFFTVYGPWGRPDMAPFKFTKAVMEGKAIEVYNNGNLSRDFTYIDDIVESILRIQNVVPQKDKFAMSSPDVSTAPFKTYNIGNGSPVSLTRFIEAIESATGIKAIKKFLPMQAGDVFTTHADTRELFNAIDYQPKVSIEEGISRFVGWYIDYYGKK